ncbi:MAG: TIGR03089 family protein, partial [Sciscionella sp.]
VALTAVVALDPMGMGLAKPPGDGKVDFLSDVRIHGDHFSPLLPVPGDTPALLKSSVDEVVAEAHVRAATLGIEPRVLSTLDWTMPEEVLDGVLAVLAAGGSLVQCVGSDAATLDSRRQAERVTTELRPR